MQSAADKFSTDSSMLDNPKLIERPIVVKDGKVAVGRPPENILSIL